jgi:hypothetical protein
MTQTQHTRHETNAPKRRDTNLCTHTQGYSCSKARQASQRNKHDEWISQERTLNSDTGTHVTSLLYPTESQPKQAD